MKIVFSTKNVSRASFLDICRYAYDYGFEGFEIYDAVGERNAHYDSILRRDRVADAKRKLVNRTPIFFKEVEYVYRRYHCRHQYGKRKGRRGFVAHIRPRCHLNLPKGFLTKEWQALGGIRTA